MKAILSPVVAVMFACCPGVNGQNQRDAPVEPKIAVIQMEQVPLSGAIENLAQQAEVNFTVDPKLIGAGHSSSEDAKWQSPVTLRWENLTAADALARLLKERDLFMVKNPQTGVARITATNAPPRIFAKELFDASKEIIPNIRLSDVPLPMAIAQFAAKTKLQFELEASLTSPSLPFAERVFVSVRFKDLTASQALAAICDQHDLQIAPTGNADVWRISRGK